MVVLVDKYFSLTSRLVTQRTKAGIIRTKARIIRTKPVMKMLEVTIEALKR